MIDFATVLGAFAREGTEIIIVGGAAATAHGSARLTSDLDVAYRRTPANIQRIVAALAPRNGQHEGPRSRRRCDAGKTVVSIRGRSPDVQRFNESSSVLFGGVMPISGGSGACSSWIAAITATVHCRA